MQQDKIGYIAKLMFGFAHTHIYAACAHVRYSNTRENLALWISCAITFTLILLPLHCVYLSHICLLDCSIAPSLARLFIYSIFLRTSVMCGELICFLSAIFFLAFFFLLSAGLYTHADTHVQYYANILQHNNTPNSHISYGK